MDQVNHIFFYHDKISVHKYKVKTGDQHLEVKSMVYFHEWVPYCIQ
jgi:hypothetical protein